jgi:predicted aspartyl protease
MADYSSSQPVRTETAGDVVAKIVDTGGTNEWSIDANNIGQVNLNDGTNSLVIGAGGEITVTFATGAEVKITDGTDDLEVNTDGSINTVITDGTDTLDINTDGSINVNIVTAAVSGEVHEYDTTSATAPNTPTTVVDYTVTAATTLLLKSWQIAGSGKVKGELKVGPAASEVTKAVAFITSSNGTHTEVFPAPIEVVAGDKVLVVMTNRDQANADLYAWINGNEV